MRISMRPAAIVLAACLVVAGCSAAVPTPQPPAPTPTDVPTEVPTDTPTPEPTPTVAPTDSVAPTATVAPTDTPVPLQTPSGVAGDPTKCTGWSANSAYFKGVARGVAPAVYCGVMPSGWTTSSTKWARPKSTVGWFTLLYKNSKHTQSITIGQGDFCAQTADPSNCWTSSSDLGAAKFGDLSGSLKDLGGGQFAVFVNPNTKTGYRIVGAGMTQAAFVKIAAAMVRIPKA